MGDEPFGYFLPPTWLVESWEYDGEVVTLYGHTIAAGESDEAGGMLISELLDQSTLDFIAKRDGLAS